MDQEDRAAGLGGHVERLLQRRRPEQLVSPARAGRCRAGKARKAAVRVVTRMGAFKVDLAVGRSGERVTFSIRAGQARGDIPTPSAVRLAVR